MEGGATSIEEQEEYATIMGLIFTSELHGFDFYNKYARERGFSVRKDYCRRDCFSGMIIHRRFTCSRQGFRKEMYMDSSNRSRVPRALSRCGCNAQFEIKLDQTKGNWYVVRFLSNHNHPLCKGDEVPFLRSHRRITPAQKAKLVELRDVGLHQHQVMDIVERDHSGYEAAGFTSRDMYNYFVKLKKKRIIGGDADHVIKYMQARQKDDMEFYYDYETDQAGCLKRLFWSDPQSRIDYDAFGEVVVFDSTYRVNKYNLPFIPFVGVNHHGSTVIFACAVVSDERVATYEWVLWQFLTCMCQKHPKSLITDGDNAMRRAIILVFPNSDHRLCTWHIEQNMARNLSPTMLSDFRNLVHAPYEEDEFERKWVEFKVKHNVSDDNKWLRRMYNLRKKWAAAYTKGRVFLGMKSNQRSESLNSKLHRLLDRKMSLVILVEHYEHCLSRIRHQEVELDAKASQSVPFTDNEASLIEKDAARLFTPKIFKKIKVEIYMGAHWYNANDDLKNIINGVSKYIDYTLKENGTSTSWNDTKVANWPRCPKNVPQQTDSWSCGLYALKFMETWNGKELSNEYFSMESNEVFRYKVAANLLSTSLNIVISVHEDIRRLQSEHSELHAASTSEVTNNI